ncbi:hypothetical protein FLONG3_5284 [Fusarium longipes]|uniref:Uncharacterized protein n=1 Tax=Fusarium longipes TaxID=694270 RepID=A0A395SV82_9HYPO|nr:hypothetical protein FLONG3_5284 [Fusarium longipes]
MNDTEAAADTRPPNANILSEDDLTIKELHSFDDLIKALNPDLNSSRYPAPALEQPAKMPTAPLKEIGVEAGVWKDNQAPAETPVSKKRKAGEDGKSTKRVKAQQPGSKAYCTISVTEKSGLNVKWKDSTSNFAGPDKVQLIGYDSIPRVRFEAIEKHDSFQRKTAMRLNREYVVSLGRQRVKHFAVAGASPEEPPHVEDILRPTRVIKPLLAADAHRAMMDELLEHQQWREESLEIYTQTSQLPPSKHKRRKD